MTPHIRVVAFLGNATKRERYSYVLPPLLGFNDREVRTSRQDTLHHEIWLRLAGWGPGNTIDTQGLSIVVIGTPVTCQEWARQLPLKLEEIVGKGRTVPVALIQHSAPHNWSAIDDPTGGFWSLFKTIGDMLDPTIEHITKPFPKSSPQNDGRWILQGKPEDFAVPATQVILDVSGGYRTYPVIASHALSLKLNELRRRHGPAPVPRYRVLCAVADASVGSDDGRVAPIWDLTSLVTATELSAGFDGFARYGRGDQLAEVLSDTKLPAAVGLGSAIKNWSDDLALMRIQSLLQSSTVELTNALSHRNEVAATYPPISDDLEKLAQRLAKAASHTSRSVEPVSRDGVTAAVHLASQLLATHRYAELAGLIRETLVSLWSLSSKESTTAPSITAAGFSDWRRGLDDFCGRSSSRWRPSAKRPKLEFPPPADGWGEQVRENIEKFYAQFADRRNDHLHWGFRYDAAKRTELHKELAQWLSELSTLVDEYLKVSGRPGS